MGRRCDHQVIRDMLHLALNGTLKTNFYLKLGMCYDDVQKWVKHLQTTGLLQFQENNGNLHPNAKGQYITTEKGQKFLNRFNQLQNLIEADDHFEIKDIGLQPETYGKMLELALDGTVQTHFCSKLGMTYHSLKVGIKHLMTRGLLTFEKNDGSLHHKAKGLYTTTEKGKCYLRRLKAEE